MYQNTFYGQIKAEKWMAHFIVTSHIFELFWIQEKTKFVNFKNPASSFTKLDSILQAPFLRRCEMSYLSDRDVQ